MSATVDWTELPSDLYDPIFNRLDLVELVRVAAVCRSWRSACLPNRRALKLPRTPWLLISTLSHPQSRYIQSPTDQNRNRKPYEIHLPQIAGQHFIGSSEGFLISVDESGEPHAINPLTGAHLPLPPTATVPDMLAMYRELNLPVNLHSHCIRYRIFKKAVLAPSPLPDNYTIVIIYCAGYLNDLAFARNGDAQWTALKSPIRSFRDAIFHKGRLLAVDTVGTLAIFDLDNTSAGPTLLPRGPLEYYNLWLSRYLIESPDGDDLFLVLKALDAHYRPKTFKVFKLNKVNFEWDETKSIGDTAMFLGFNHSVSFSAHNFPLLQKNSIYFTYDFFDLPESGVFSLEDGSIQLFSLCGFCTPPIWYTPALS